MDSKEEYSCECGKMTGKFYEGCICQKCGKPVSFVGLSVGRYGWIDLSLSKYNEDGEVIEKGNGCHIIQYIPYSQLEKIIGRENLRKIIHVYNTITVTGEINTEELEALRNESPESKYYYLGLDGFYEKYEEILEYYNELKGNKFPELYNFLKNKEEIFIDSLR